MKRHVGSNPTVSAIFVKSARLALADLVLFRYFDEKRKEENAFIAEFAGMPAFSQGRTEGENCKHILFGFFKPQTAQHHVRRVELGAIIQVRVDVGRGGKVAVSQPFLDLLHRYAVGQHQ